MNLKASSSRKDWILHAGKGSRGVFIGQTPAQVEHIFGTPGSIVSKFTGHHYYLYPEIGLQIDFGSSQGSAKVLFFYRIGVEGYSQSPAKTPEGLTPGSQKSAVIAALGPPEKRGGNAKLKHDTREWLWYGRGIQFDVNQSGIVDVIAIFDTQRTFEEQL